MLEGKSGVFKGHIRFVTSIVITVSDVGHCAAHWTASSVPPASGVTRTDCSYGAMGSSCFAHGKHLYLSIM